MCDSVRLLYLLYFVTAHDSSRWSPRRPLEILTTTEKKSSNTVTHHFFFFHSPPRRVGRRVEHNKSACWRCVLAL